MKLTITHKGRTIVASKINKTVLFNIRAWCAEEEKYGHKPKTEALFAAIRGQIDSVHPPSGDGLGLTTKPAPNSEPQDGGREDDQDKGFVGVLVDNEGGVLNDDELASHLRRRAIDELEIASIEAMDADAETDEIIDAINDELAPNKVCGWHPDRSGVIMVMPEGWYDD